MSHDVWVVVEHQDGLARKISLELLGCARALAAAWSGKVVAFVPGGSTAQVAAALGARGADMVFAAEHPLLQRYTTDGYATVQTEALRADPPAVALFGATSQGRDLAPRVAARLGVGIVTDCTSVGVQDGTLVATRPMYTRKAIGTIRFKETAPRIAVVLPAMYPLPPEQPQRKAEIRSWPVQLDARAIRTTVREVKTIQRETIPLIDADIIVSGGRGMKGPENFALLDALARALGGAGGSSRAPVDSGGGPAACEDGPAGKTVSPQVYLACGISGAPQHLAGMSGAKHIIAINKDPNAPLLQLADLGIVGDLFQILPKLTDAVKRVKSSP